jgi:hypothetical protein
MRRGKVSLLVIATALAACSESPVLTMTPVPSPSPAASVAAARSAAAAASLTPARTFFGTIAVPGGIKSMTVRLAGDPRVFGAWRAATTPELERSAGSMPDNILLARLGGLDFLLAWIGSACDVGAVLEIERASLVLTEDPRRGCDAIGVTKGVVLTARAAFESSKIRLALVRATLLP